MGTWGRGDVGTRGRGDAVTGGRGDAVTGGQDDRMTTSLVRLVSFSGVSSRIRLSLCSASGVYPDSERE